MRTRLCDTFGIEYPIFAFTRSPAVVAEVSKAGGLGVLGAIAFNAEQLAEALAWVDEHVEGKPYGVDVVMPAAIVEGADPAAFQSMIPEEHQRFVAEVLDRYNVPPLPEGQAPPEGLLSWVHDKARSQVEVALAHPIRLLANALGPPPEDVVQAAHRKGVQVAALVGSAEQARRQVQAGVDIIIAQGSEAGGHTGMISTMVLVPEVVETVAPVPVLAAGGIGTGRQVAAALALGAEGAWTGSLWLTAAEADTHPVVVNKLLAASSRDTVRSRSWTGKPARLLRTAWTDAWDAEDSPGTLPMPLQFMLTAEAIGRMHTYADREDSGAKDLVGSPVGQIVGSMTHVRPAGEVVADLVSEFEQVAERVAQVAKATAAQKA
jgi:NAD(P)H-dependent flavin oxidoreductase YrpB (nitropropane dioxygenase family)